MLVAYRSIMFMRNIQLRKATEAKKAQEKAERDGVPLKKAEEEKEGGVPTNEQIIEQRLNNEGGSSLSYQQKQAEEEAAERKEYGRYWMWDGYFNEKNQQMWLDTAEMRKHVNNHVLQDIED